MNAIDYPQLTLPDGKTYRIRFSMKSARLLTQWGIPETTPTNPEEVWAQLTGQVAGAAYLESETGEMNFADLTPEYVRGLFPDDAEMYQVKAMRAAVQAAVNFRMPSDESSQSQTAFQAS